MFNRDCAENYERIDQIGSGTFGIVFKSRHKQSGQICALKKLLNETGRDGMNLTTVREIRLLKKLKHENIVKLISAFRGNTSTYTSFEYCEFDMYGLMHRPDWVLTPPHIKCLMKQMLSAMAYIHDEGVLHRDIKSANIFLTRQGIIKIGDFGLARDLSHPKVQHHTNRVVTTWYRCPELLLGATQYGGEVDMWAIGCIFAELLTKKPLFPGKSDVAQLETVYKIHGSPTLKDWPDMINMPWLLLISPRTLFPDLLRTHIQDLAAKCQQDGSLLYEMLDYNPEKRITAKDALGHRYFKSHPLPSEPKDIPLLAKDFHEGSFKKARRRNAQ
ncbi:Pkinase-domain-containing protein [Ramicandelaber brevisporus]|nr:Pkinase-domain-containing protein [Ramicandelaber brevisporus]KAI8867926.1 Pkinase-domain-containing protein [Ramicandelaber brevisporus]